jgi:hypothetical protein
MPRSRVQLGSLQIGVGALEQELERLRITGLVEALVGSQNQDTQIEQGTPSAIAHGNPDDHKIQRQGEEQNSDYFRHDFLLSGGDAGCGVDWKTSLQASRESLGTKKL